MVHEHERVLGEFHAVLISYLNMKISKSLLSKICITAGFILCSLLSFATTPVLLPPDGTPTPEPGQTNGPTIDEPYASASATISDVELAVFFEWEVGNAIITLRDANDSVVCQTTVDTYSTREVYIPVSTGEYTLTVTYGTTTQRGSFQIQ